MEERGAVVFKVGGNGSRSKSAGEGEVNGILIKPGQF
jgi:hypothetical protein